MSEQRETESPVIGQRPVEINEAIASEKRSERKIAIAFIIGIVAGLAFMVDYVQYGASTPVLGISMAIALGGIGYGLGEWGLRLMPQGPYQEEREEMPTRDIEKEAFQVAFARGETIQRRSFLRRLLLGAMGVFGLASLFPLKSLGPQPNGSLYHTKWRPGSRMVNINNRAIKVSDIEVGGFLTVFPEGHLDSAVSTTLLIRADSKPLATRPGRLDWSPAGYVAFSKICTHAGCPVGLYEHATQQLLCPCHQSLFDIKDGCKPIFGPASTPLPQLPLTVDKQGYLIAQSDYLVPIGPQFWGTNKNRRPFKPYKAV